MGAYKSKQYLFVLLKVIVVIAALGFIYVRLHDQGVFDRAGFGQLFFSSSLFQAKTLLILFSLTTLNWLFEIFKWQVLSKQLRTISFPESARQVLSAHTTSIFTPFKMGEYGAKTIFFRKNQAKKVLFLNFLGNMAQLSATLFFGLIGLFFYIEWNFPQWLVSYIVCVGIGMLFLFLGRKWLPFKNFKIKGFSLKKSSDFVAGIPKRDRFKVVAFSFLRYVFFSFQFCFLLSLGTSISWFEVYLLVFAMYLLSSALPVLQLFDFAVKGSVAVLLFTTIPSQIVISVAFFMWLLNAMLPALVGSYFVLSFNTNRLLKPVKE